MTLALVEPAITLEWEKYHRTALLQGEIMLQTRPYSIWGGAVTAQMYLPLERGQVWQKLIDYPRWVQYFPSLNQSQVLRGGDSYKRLYQVAGKALLFFSAQVEIYLKVLETVHPRWHQIQFQLEQGNFKDFTAVLKLQDYNDGTLLTYSVQATPSIPIPTQIIQEGIRLDLPHNMRSMRRVICYG
jgi:Polyketide cyclase / dehydrase and lipid transport